MNKLEFGMLHTTKIIMEKKCFGKFHSRKTKAGIVIKVSQYNDCLNNCTLKLIIIKLSV